MFDYRIYRSMTHDATRLSKGDLLLSEPFLNDGNFERSVILMCEHNEEGSLGFVLNKPSLLTLEDVLDEVSGFEQLLYTGGPVQQNTLHFVHRLPQLVGGADGLGENIFWGGDYDQLLMMINTRQVESDYIRFFVGYSGWSPGQLAAELEQDAWIVYKQATVAQVFDVPPERLWQEVLRTMGGRYHMFSNYPIDPRLN